jgi:hypothetical protein
MSENLIVVAGRTEQLADLDHALTNGHCAQCVAAPVEGAQMV